jgi:hypothetical protein
MIGGAIMTKLDDIGLRILISLILIVGSLYIPTPVFSQQDLNIQNIIANGNFEEGFQEFGVAYGWGAFSNGQAAVGWNVDTWEKIILEGQTNAQMIEIKNALERDRYAGIYQTVPVVSGQQYKLTVKGLIRSTEGDIETSDYGYRLQYGVDHSGGAAWELIAGKDWHELPWNEQPLFEPPDGAYRFDTFEATITARSDQLTLFVRGWKKWINNGSGLFDLQEISLVGPAPEGFVSSSGQVASVGNSAPESTESFVSPNTVEGNEDAALEQPQEQAPSESGDPSEAEAPSNDQSQTEAQLPVSGRGQDDSINYVMITSVILLLVLVVGAVTATLRWRRLTE